MTKEKRPIEEILLELQEHGGTYKVLADAQLLCLEKDKDYNQGPSGRDAYFPFGVTSYLQMIHIKSMRLISLSVGIDDIRFEGLRDSAVDLLNYTTFLIERLDRGDL